MTALDTTPRLRTGANRPRPEAAPLPAWPVLVLLWGLPVWWMAGMLAFATIVMAVPMLAFLLRRGRTLLTPGALPWLAFVVWMLPCALMVDTVGRLGGFGLRFAQFASVAVLLVYVLNASETLRPKRLLSGLTFTWVFVIVGGYLGMLFPHTVLTATVGQLLPVGLQHNEYIADMLFPGFAEIQTPYGAEEPFVRPSAPFSYTNGWGAAMAILTPVAVASASAAGTARATLWLLAGLLAAVPPAIATTNRGLFIGILVAVGYVLVRLVFRGRWRPALWVGSLGALLFVILWMSGLIDGIVERQETVDTTEGRGGLYAETFTRTLESPLLGFGAPRPSFSSEITAGTQGMVWNAMFCFGFVGLALFILFMAGAVLRTWAAPNVTTLWLHSALVAACALSIFYGLDRHMMTICIVAGLLLRERYAASSPFWVADPVPEVVRRGW
ncbi:hypothetical protein ACFFGH_31830 [Lysobacter korlensis]|uniref:Uncharacterized protein n=1 Tax=Lysobacter korlensis TaxID=553636 RepID=A0ABV6RZN6_9GAMM